MRLPNGVTGYSDSADNQLTPMDEKQFKQLCYSIINHNGGTLNNLRDPSYPMSFYHANISFNTEEIYILLNKHYPLLAFASSVNYEYINFIDLPHLVETFPSFYKVLHTSELNQPVIIKSNSKHDFLQNDHDLNLTELENIKFWKPNKVGEIIFNYWD